jgi:hypothetical protein
LWFAEAKTVIAPGPAYAIHQCGRERLKYSHALIAAEHQQGQGQSLYVAPVISVPAH